jgi:hypothetical protein
VDSKDRIALYRFMEEPSAVASALMAPLPFIVHTFYKPEVSGEDKIPKSGAYVLAVAPHIDPGYEPLYAVGALPELYKRKGEIALLGKAPDQRHPLFNKAHLIPAYRSADVERKYRLTEQEKRLLSRFGKDGNGSPYLIEEDRLALTRRNTMEPGGDWLKRGRILMGCPDGTRSDESLGTKALYSGLAALALKGDAPLIPVFVYAEHTLWESPRKGKAPLFVRVGEAVQVNSPRDLDSAVEDMRAQYRELSAGILN